MSKRWGMVIDLKKCIGCHTCTLACKVKNGTGPGIFWNFVIDQEKGVYPDLKRQFIPRPCMHCLNAPCIEVCPTKASYKTEEGIVQIEERKCVGCKQCLIACPYGARYLNEGKRGYYTGQLTPAEEILIRRKTAGVVEKCDFCAREVAEGREPFCVITCPLRARVFGDLNDPESEVVRLISSRGGFNLLEELKTEPAVFYLPF